MNGLFLYQNRKFSEEKAKSSKEHNDRGILKNDQHEDKDGHKDGHKDEHNDKDEHN